MSTNRNGEPPTFLTGPQREILRKSALCASLTDDQCQYFFEVVERTKLDPFTGQIRPDVRNKRNDDGTKTPSLLIITTLQGLRTIGDRTGQHDGESAPEWCDAEGNWSEVWLPEAPPNAARASVFRKDRPRPQISTVRWDAFVQVVFNKQGKLEPNPFWKKMGSHMLAKCALAGAYRGAYPNQCSGLYISEELGAVIDEDSEEAIEAEMVRRARAEHEHWESERAKGNLDIAAQQRADGVSPRPNERQEAISQAELRMPDPSPAPIAPSDPGPTGASRTPAQDTPSPAFYDFVITRINFFKGRTVGSLSATEMEGIKPFLAKMKESYASLDKELQAHYRALRERIEADAMASLDALASQMDFTQGAPQGPAQ